MAMMDLSRRIRGCFYLACPAALFAKRSGQAFSISEASQNYVKVVCHGICVHNVVSYARMLKGTSHNMSSSYRRTRSSRSGGNVLWRRYGDVIFFFRSSWGILVVIGVIVLVGGIFSVTTLLRSPPSQDKQNYSSPINIDSKEQSPEQSQSWEHGMSSSVGDLYKQQQEVLIEIQQTQYDGTDLIAFRKRIRTLTDKRISLIEKAIEQDPNNALLWNTLGNAYLWPQKNPIEKVTNSLQKAIELDPDNSTFIIDLGKVYYRENNYEKALKTFVRATEANPADGNAHFMVGEIHRRQEDFDKAEGAYIKARMLYEGSGDNAKVVLTDNTIQQMRAPAKPTIQSSPTASVDDENELEAEIRDDKSAEQQPRPTE